MRILPLLSQHLDLLARVERLVHKLRRIALDSTRDGRILHVMKRAAAIFSILVLVCLTEAYAGKPRSLTFKAVTAAEGLSGSAEEEAGFHTHLGLTGFEASNGKRAVRTSAYFDTAEEAKRYFDWKLKQAGQIVEQGNKTVKGKVVGRRAVISEKSGRWQVMITYGNTFLSYGSDDRAVALELERQY